MYTIIADSGSTKTDWVILKESKVYQQIKTIGFNPYFQSQDQISLEIINNLKPKISEVLNKVSAVYFYGAGCSTFENCLVIENAIVNTLNVAKVSVSHDLLAAARALCKKGSGIACILGTGSNSCLYNGKVVTENVPSVGYLWGDHGSGAQIGKYFVTEYFNETLPSDLRKQFEIEGYNREEILNNVYKKSMPSKYLASISKFVGANKNHVFIKNLLHVCFDSFFKQQINKYTDSKNYQVNTVGSVGFFYKDIIAEVAKKNGYKMGLVIQSPIEGLIDFHK